MIIIDKTLGVLVEVDLNNIDDIEKQLDERIAAAQRTARVLQGAIEGRVALHPLLARQIREERDRRARR